MSDNARDSRSKTRRHDYGHKSRRKSHRKSRDIRTRTPSQPREVDSSMQQTLNSILARLNTLEGNQSTNTSRAHSVRDENNHEIPTISNATSHGRNVTLPPHVLSTELSVHRNDVSDSPTHACELGRVIPLTTPSSRTRLSATPVDHQPNKIIDSDSNVNPQNFRDISVSETAQILTDAIKSISAQRSQPYFVSSFDPSLHNIDTWCTEVERAKINNGWTDSECLSRVSKCLRGDARTWLDEWVTSERTWSNFVKEFKPLCPRKLDYANILFETMNTTSDKFNTYAEYARRTLLRLRVVKGLSEELMTLIIIRGIGDPQVRAAAANANLNCENIVSFLSIYVKSGGSTSVRDSLRTSLPTKRPMPSTYTKAQIKCYDCGRAGHKRQHCPKKPKTDSVSKLDSAGLLQSGTVFEPKTTKCGFCKKPGHHEEQCFAKNRSDPRNKRNVNLCAELSVKDPSRSNDISTAVIQGVPVDVLIDSGALNVSLISADVLKYFTCEPKPINCTLKGISQNTTHADSYVTLTIEFDEITIEADLVVVPGSCTAFPVIVGTDILNRDGITYVRSKDKQYLTRSPVSQSQVNTVVLNLHEWVSTPLQGEQRQSLMAVIDEFSDYLISGTASTTVTTGKMSINVKDETPVAYRPYKLSHQEKLKVRDIIRDLKEKGIVRDSNSEYASPILLVKKKDGTDRMCVDYRALNRLTVRDRYPMPLIDDHIDRLGNFRCFSSLDMATGFHQIPIEEESIHRTAFVTPEGHYEYLKMPYGLTNSPIVYQRIINNVLRKHIEDGNVLVYVDDVLIMSNQVDDGIRLLRDVLRTLTNAGFSINLKKCSFLTTTVEYLGRVVSQGQVRPSPRKVEALVNAPVPTNVRQVRQFLGLAGYFRRYVKDYAGKTTCISRLTTKNVDFCWGPEQERARQEILTCLTNEPVLTIFDPTLPTEVHTDASSIGYGAILIQTRANGEKHAVAYYSKKTQGAESKYHSYELETLAVVRALQHFRHYLIGIKFKVVTDCNALKATEKKKDLLPRVARWWVYLQDFTFDIEYRKGKMMPHADYLSRNPSIREVNQISKPRNWAQIAQSADDETQGLLQKLQDGQLDPRRYTQQNGLLYYRYTPVGSEPRLLCYIPKGHRLSLLRIFHDEHEHIGADKTLNLVLKHFWFPGLRQFVMKYIAHCLVCVSKKRVPRAPHQPITSWGKPDAPFDTLHLDALGPLPESNGYKYVLLMVDAFSKFCLLYAIHKQDASELIRTLTNAVSLFGAPKLLVSDRGRMFESSDFTRFISELGCSIHYITPEMHHSNGQIERFVRTVLNMIRIEANHKKASWSDQLWKLQLVVNITKHKTTQASAMNLLIGTEATTPIIRSLVRDVAVQGAQSNREAWREMCRARASELLKKNQQKQDAYVNRNRHPPHNFKVNDLVFVIKYSQSTGKLDPGMRGPYKVIKALPSDRYELKLLSGSYGKTTQAAAEYMVAWRGEWCPETCASFFENNNEDDDSSVGSSARNRPLEIFLKKTYTCLPTLKTNMESRATPCQDRPC